MHMKRTDLRYLKYIFSSSSFISGLVVSSRRIVKNIISLRWAHKTKGWSTLKYNTNGIINFTSMIKNIDSEKWTILPFFCHNFLKNSKLQFRNTRIDHNSILKLEQLNWPEIVGLCRLNNENQRASDLVQWNTVIIGQRIKIFNPSGNWINSCQKEILMLHKKCFSCFSLAYVSCVLCFS